MASLLKKIFGTAQGRILSKYRKIVHEVNKWDKQFQTLADEELRQKTEEFRHRIRQGETVDSLLPEAYAVVKGACRRLCGTDVHVSGYDQKWDMVPYDVQILGAIAMHYGHIAEMQTGEGKTLTASMPLYLNALTGKPVHLVTVNDYLAKRDSDWIGSIFRWLGLTVSALTGDTPGPVRKEVYAADIVYGTSSEFGFDYLRDNSMAQSREEQCQRGHYFAMIDEVDSILIDEARTPLIISGPSTASYQMYNELKEDVANLVRLQRNACNRFASEAQKMVETLGIGEEGKERKFTKAEEGKLREAAQKLWLVAKGTPQNKILKRLKEDPSIRGEVDKWETYYHAEPNKEEKLKILSELYITVDERASEYELTDKGIHAWNEGKPVEEDDFTMLDLGFAYAEIDNDDSLDEKEKMTRKVALREEDAKRKERSHNLRQMLRAHLLMERDIDYIVADGKIVIIDENTGRPQPGRRFSDGLHQAIEAKENVHIQGETQTFATITLQNYFRLYDKLSGMTGTAMTEANEFKEIYKIDVLAIPTHRACQRKDFDDVIYMTEREKYNAILEEVRAIHEKGRPILIGTESVEVSEKLSRILKQNKLPHTVLNAKQHDKEAEIIADAGKEGAITIATNMAGRGTDIKLKPEVAALGGLHVIGTTRHQSRRIDRQLRGRSGRLGDPGSSKFFICFEDSLMRLFTSPRVTGFLQRFRPPEGEPISAKMLNKSIETAQKRVEQRNYTMRKHTLEYDDVMNKQRTEIYAFRSELLQTDDALTLAKDVLESVVIQMASRFFATKLSAEGWNPDGFRQWMMTHFPLTIASDEFDSDYLDLAEIERRAIDKVLEAFIQKIGGEQAAITQMQSHPALQNQPLDAEKVVQTVVRNIMIRHIDQHWQEHLLRIDHLRSEVNLRAVGQKDPLLEFKHEAFALFDELSLEIKLSIVHALFKFTFVIQQPQPQGLEEKIERVQAKQKPEVTTTVPYRTNLSLFSDEEVT